MEIGWLLKRVQVRERGRKTTTLRDVKVDLGVETSPITQIDTFRGQEMVTVISFRVS